ncbi:hypothetical protein BGZ98_002125, partial [Dissophora globulifera]
MDHPNYNASPQHTSREAGSSSQTPQQQQQQQQHFQQQLSPPPHSPYSDHQHQQQQQQQQLLEQPLPQPLPLPQPSASSSSSSSSSRVLPSFVERRRRATFFRSFYPLLSRSPSSTPANNASSAAYQAGGSSSSVPGASTPQRPGLNPTASASSTTSYSDISRLQRPFSQPRSQTGVLSPSPPPGSGSNGRTPRGLSRVQRLYDEHSIHTTRDSSRASSIHGATSPAAASVVNVSSEQTSHMLDMEVDPESVGVSPYEQHLAYQGEAFLLSGHVHHPAPVQDQSSLWPQEEHSSIYRTNQEPSSMDQTDRQLSSMDQTQHAPLSMDRTHHESSSMSQTNHELLSMDQTGQEPSSMSHTDREPSSTDRTDQEATPTDNETRPASGIDRSQFLLNQLPFFMRLLADITQSTQNTHGSEAGDATEVAPSGENPSSSAQAGGSENGEAPSLIAEGSTAPNDGANANFNARPRRHHATIRFIQVGGGPGRRSGVQTPSQEGGEDEAERDSNATPLGDDVNEAVIMFLTGPNNDAASDTEDSNGEGSGQDGSNGTDTTGGRRRHRAPWVVMTLSGAYLSSLMAAGVGGEGGANYDDLWMLSNLIGPARPITTTQEAIDNAGFAVGRFEQEFQGM